MSENVGMCGTESPMIPRAELETSRMLKYYKVSGCFI